MKKQSLNEIFNKMLKTNNIEDVMSALLKAIYNVNKKQILDSLLSKLKGESTTNEINKK